MADQLNDFLKSFLGNQQAAIRSAVAVQSVADSKWPGRYAHSLEGVSKALVQARMGELCEEAADKGGSAQFIGPHRTGRGTWAALGETIVPVAEQVAA